MPAAGARRLLPQVLPPGQLGALAGVCGGQQAQQAQQAQQPGPSTAAASAAASSGTPGSEVALAGALRLARYTLRRCDAVACMLARLATVPGMRHVPCC